MDKNPNKTITRNWADQSKQLKTKDPQLMDADLKFEPGEKNELFGRIASGLNKNREEAIRIIKKG